MEQKNEIITASHGCEIVATRVVNAAREIVFKAWADPDHLKNWWGPHGFSNTFKEFDLRPEGKWSFVMHGPDGKDYPNESVFVKIEKPGLLVWNHLSNPKFQVVAIFEEVSKEKTEVRFKMVFNTTEECDKVKAYAQSKNEENLDRLEKELSRMNSKNIK